MSLDRSRSLRVHLYEGEGALPLGEEERGEILSALLQGGYAVRCGSSPPAPENGRVSLLVLGRFPGGAAPDFGPGIGAEDIGGQEAGEVVRRVAERRGRLEAFPHGEWKPWFPVIDYDRCTNCMQCLSFCLFGVYGVDEENRLQVQNQDSCKTNCPACSRVCPEAAIMFPKYRTGPINGDRVSAADLDREKMKIDISSLLGGDIYQMLRSRSEKARSRFAKERSPDKALNERRKCLTKLAHSGDIPPEVLMSLPSEEEIRRRAREAAGRAEEAREKAQAR